MRTEVLEFSSVSKRYRGAPEAVLTDLDLVLVPGSLLQVRGGNGSGKSTLLRLAAGFARPTRGAVQRSFSSLSFLPDTGTAGGRFTARAYLRELGAIRGLRRGEVRSRVEELDARFGVVPGLDVAASTLSKGNRQKVAVMQAFLAPADLIVMDEPTTALDDGAIAALRVEIERALAAGASVLIAGHGDELDGLGTTLVLRDGRLVRAAGEGVPPLATATTVELAGPRALLERVARAMEIPALTIGESAAEFAVERARVSELLRCALDAGCDVTRVEPGP